MGGLAPKLPWTHGVMLIACIAIAGIPPFAGFFSKDEILHAAFASGHYGIWVAGVIGAAMTAFYMFRLYILTFRGPSRVSHEAEHHLHESPPAMIAPLPLPPEPAPPPVPVVPGDPGWPGSPTRRLPLQVEQRPSLQTCAPNPPPPGAPPAPVPSTPPEPAPRL